MRLTWFDGNNAEDGHRIYVSTRVIKENLKDNNNINLIPYIEKTGDKQSLGNITILSSEVSEILYFGDKQAVYNSTTKVLTINGRTVGNIKVNGHGFSKEERVIVNGVEYYVIDNSLYTATTFQLTSTKGSLTEATFVGSSVTVKSGERFINYRIAAYKQSGSLEEVALSENWTVFNPDNTVTPRLKLSIRVGTAKEKFKLPLTFEAGSNYNFAVDWGDNTRHFIYKDANYDSTGLAEHVYSSTGLYTVTIVGNIEGFSFANSSSAPMLLRVLSWGELKFNGSGGGIGGYLYGCKNLLEIPNTNISLQFNGTENNLNFGEFFRGCEVFNSALSNWVTTRVVNMWRMFNEARLFNQSLNTWNTVNVTSMRRMFEDAEKFNGVISNWNTSNVNNMSLMFKGAKDFNQAIGNWNVNKVTTIEEIFAVSASKRIVSFLYKGNIFESYRPVAGFEMTFNQPLGDWFNGEQVELTNVAFAFHGCSNFNQDIATWKIGKVTSMRYMFHHAKAFNNGGNSMTFIQLFWDTRQVTNIQGMFYEAQAFLGHGVHTWDLRSLYGQTTSNYVNSSALGVFVGSALMQTNYESILATTGWAAKLAYVSPGTRTIYFDGRPGTSIEVQREPLTGKGWIVIDNSNFDRFIYEPATGFVLGTVIWSGPVQEPPRTGDPVPGTGDPVPGTGDPQNPLFPTP